MNKTICCDSGRHLEKNQIPDGTHSGEKAKNLKPEQTPDQKDVLNSDIYAKSKKTPLRKEAASEEEEKKDEKKEEKAATLEDIKKMQVEKEKEKGEKAEDKAEKKTEETGKALEEAKKSKEKSKEKAESIPEDKPPEDKPPEDKKEATSCEIEGIELSAPMEEANLDAAEAAKLSKLFV
jgi:hypothetical protein